MTKKIHVINCINSRSFVGQAIENLGTNYELYLLKVRLDIFECDKLKKTLNHVYEVFAGKFQNSIKFIYRGYVKDSLI